MFSYASSSLLTLVERIHGRDSLEVFQIHGGLLSRDNIEPLRKRHISFSFLFLLSMSANYVA